MKKLVFLTVIIASCFVSCKSSYTRIGDKNANYIPYYLKVYEADSLYIIGDYQKSYELLDSLFLKYEPVEVLFYNEYRTFVKVSFMTGNKEKASNGLKNLIENYGLTLGDIKRDTVLDTVLNSSKLYLKYNNLREKYLKSTNDNIREKILQMRISDQQFRGKNVDSLDMVKQAEIDSINSVELIEIFNLIGYPNIRKIGMGESTKQRDLDITVILLHTDFLQREKYFLPKIAEFVTKGECNPEVYGYMYDQMLLYNRIPQKYGTYTGSEVKSKDSLDYFRMSIGLPKNSYTKWRMKTLYNLDIN